MRPIVRGFILVIGSVAVITIDVTFYLIKYSKKNEILSSIYSSIGLQLSKDKRHKDALKAYTRAIKLNLKSFDTYYNKGITYHKTEKYEDAINDYSKAIELYPN